MGRSILAILMSIAMVATGAAGVALHVCQSMGGVAVTDCDCERQAEHAGHGEHASRAEHRAPARVDAQPCCSVETAGPSGLMATHEAPQLRVDDAAVAFASLTRAVHPVFRLGDGFDVFRERAPPNIHGPPVFIRNCSFLN